MQRICFLLIIVGLLAACHKKEQTVANRQPIKAGKELEVVPVTIEEKVKASQLDVKAKTAMTENLKKQKDLIDTLFNRQTKQIAVFVKLPSKYNVVRVHNEKWPEEIETTYNILENAKGQVIRISEFPYSESGDWEIMYSHYFDEEGRTFTFERVTSAFNDFCPNDESFDEITRERITKVFSPEFYLVDSTYIMMDAKGVDITRKKCIQEVESNNHVFSQLNEYLKSNKIQL